MASRETGDAGELRDWLGRLQSSRVLPWVAVVGWMALIFIVSAQSTMPTWAPSFEFRDILGHFAAYGILALLVRCALASAGVGRASVWALAVVALYALSDEFHQSFVPGRHTDPLDLAVDVIGAAAVLIVFRWIAVRRRA